MEQVKDRNVPLCDLSLSVMRNRLIPTRQQSTCGRASRPTIHTKMKVTEEFESDSSSEEEEETSEVENVISEEDEEWEPSEVENITPEKETKKNIYMKKTSKDNEKSDYEKMIQSNREKRLAFLQTLDLDEVKESFCKAVKDLKPKRKPKDIKRPAPSSPPVLRKSRRLAKQDAEMWNLSEDSLKKRAIEEAKRENEISEPKELPEALEFEEAMKGKEMFSQFVSDISELDVKKATASYELVSCMKNMKICESQIAKVVPSRITAMAVHPVCDKIIVIAADKYGHVGFWNMNSDSNPYVFGPHLEGVTNIKCNPYDSNQILSSSYDGTLRCGDLTKHVFEEVYKVSDRICCTYFDVLSKTTFIVAHKDGDVAVLDSRGRKKSVKNHNCHDYSVKSVCVHPVNKNYFISSEIKGTIRLWDLRKLQKQPVADIKHHRKSATSAFFSPVTGNSILSTSLDDSLCIFDSYNLSDDISLKKSINHNNCTGRWLSPFKAVWVLNTDDTFVVGSMLYPRMIQVFNDDGHNIHNLIEEELLSSITCLHAFHPSLPVLAGANSSGKVFVFTDAL